MRRTVIFVLVISVTFCCGSCRRLPDRPEGMPELTPCTIEVTFGGERLADVGVLLAPKNTGNGTPTVWPAGGKTDVNGKAVMKTAAHYTGVVPGEYVVSFEKYAPEDMRRDGMPLPAKPLVPLKYSQKQSKEIVTVVKTQAVYNFELDAL